MRGLAALALRAHFVRLSALRASVQTTLVWGFDSLLRVKLLIPSPVDPVAALRTLLKEVRFFQGVPNQTELPIEAGPPDPYLMLGDESPGPLGPCFREGRRAGVLIGLEPRSA